MQLRKSQIIIVSSWELLTIWNSSNCKRKTLPECSTRVRMHKVPAGALGSFAATKSQTLILPSYAPETILLLSNRMQRTSSSWPSRILKQTPFSMSQSLMVQSEDPLTTRSLWYCRQAMPRLCPLSVLTNSQVDVFQTLIVRSPEAETMYLSSKSTTFTAARCPTRTLRKLISVGEFISHTAIERSLEHVTWKRGPIDESCVTAKPVSTKLPSFHWKIWDVTQLHSGGWACWPYHPC